MNFNKQCLRPDTIQEDDLSTFLPAHSTTIEIGFRLVTSSKRESN